MSQFWTSIANTAVKNMHYFSKFLRVKFHCPICSSLSSLKITIFTEVKVHIPNDINLKYLLNWWNILEASPCQTWVIFACSGTVNLRWNDAKRKFVQKSLKADYLAKPTLIREYGVKPYSHTKFEGIFIFDPKFLCGSYRDSHLSVQVYIVFTCLIS